MISITLTTAGLVEGEHCVGEIERGGNLRVSRVGVGNHAAAGGGLAKANQIIFGVDQRDRGRHGQLGGIAGHMSDAVGSREGVTAIVGGLHVRKVQSG